MMKIIKIFLIVLSITSNTNSIKYSFRPRYTGTRTVVTGSSGTEGPAGPTGLPGPTGPPGTKGDTGSTGLPGPKGSTGLPGTKGLTGPTGLPGTEGPVGPAGLPGTKGPAGPIGPPGTKGHTGQTGFPGTKGSRGPPGLPGPTGPPGTKGATGPTGLPGPKGLAGPTGLPGMKGPAGPTGLPGTKGSFGPPGANGLTGATGLPGTKGSAGPPGQKGETGKAAKDHTQKITELENEIESLKNNSRMCEEKLDEMGKNENNHEEQLSSLQSKNNHLEQELSSLQSLFYTFKIEQQQHLTTIQPLIDSLNERYEIKLTPRKGTYDEVRQMCVEMGGDLLQKCLSITVNGITYAREINDLLDLNHPWNHPVFWIGINDREIEGQWRYLNGNDFYGHTEDGEDLLYFWDKGQPGKSEDCGAFYKRQLHDFPCNDSFQGICEISV